MISQLSLWQVCHSDRLDQLSDRAIALAPVSKLTIIKPNKTINAAEKSPKGLHRGKD